jgi:uncharacterized protein YjbI with pentapeptide repeats
LRLISKSSPVVNLEDADLSRARLYKTSLRDVDLSNADLSSADLQNADLSGAVLRGANLGHQPWDTDLLSGADLSGAILAGATGITNEELEQQAASLKGATMPNGQKHEDWLKDKED